MLREEVKLPRDADNIFSLRKDIIGPSDKNK